MTDEELIARLRNYGHVGTVLEAADRIEALVKYRDVYAKMERIATDALRKSEALRDYNRKTNDLIARHAEQVEALVRERDDAIIKRAAWELEAKTLQARLTAALKGADHE